MKPIVYFRLFLLSVIASLLSSCAVDPYAYGGGAGYGGGTVSSGGYVSRSDYAPSVYRNDDYVSRSSYYEEDYAPVTRYRSAPFFGGGGYYGRSYSCPRCHANPCRCSSRSYRSSSGGHAHSSHSDREDRSHARNNIHRETGRDKVRLSSNRASLPQGTHSRDWFAKRGINVERHNYVTEHGKKHKKH